MSKKRSKKIASHPKVAEQIHQSELLIRRAQYRMKKLEDLMDQYAKGKSQSSAVEKVVKFRC